MFCSATRLSIQCAGLALSLFLWPEISASQELEPRALSRRLGRWFLDVYGGAWLFTDNKTFYPGVRTRSQAPIASTQFHISYNIRPRLWVGFNANFYAGGRTSIDGVPSQDLQKNSRLGTTLAIPFSKRQSFKVAYSRGALTTIGADFQAFAVGWQYLWGAGL
jgi:hypothetical protein